MRNNKKIAALATGALVLGSAGVAYSYWTTTGSGDGTGSTTAGVVDMVDFDQNALTAMYPGDSSQPLTVTVTNDSTESAYIATVKAYITTNKIGCTGADFLLGGQDDAVDEASAVTMTWAAQDLVAAGSDTASSTIQFNNTGAEQNACKSATVTIHYLAS